MSDRKRKSDLSKSLLLNHRLFADWTFEIIKYSTILKHTSELLLN